MQTTTSVCISVSLAISACASAFAGESPCVDLVLDDDAFISEMSTHPAERVTCPGPASGYYKGSLYNFTYESWIRLDVDKHSFVFGRCVENLFDEPMYLKWADLCCHVEGGNTAKHYISRRADQCASSKDEIWYGARPDNIELDVFYPRMSAVKKADFLMDSGKELTSDQELIRSYARVAIPTDQADPSGSLVTVDMYFSSQVIQNPQGKYDYDYSLLVYAESVSDAFRLRSLGIEVESDPGLIAMVLQLRHDPRWFAESQNTKALKYNVNMVPTTKRMLQNTDEGPEEVRGMVKLVDRNKDPLAEFPVAFHQPRS